ncbi:MAG: thioredoxin domain-containing protein [Myxococcales bacterium]
MKPLQSFRSVALLCVLGAAGCKTGSSRNASEKNPVSVDPGEKVAVIDGQPITYGDVEKQSGGKLKQAEVKALTDLYDARRGAIDEMLTKRLLEDEARSKGKTLDQWYQTDFQQSLPAPTEDELKQLYEQHKNEVGGQSYEQVHDRLVQFVKQQKSRDQMQTYVEQLKQKHGVQITMQPPSLPRVEVAAKGPSRGPDNAPVTIVEFSDFQCPYCGRAFPTVEKLMKDYDGKVRLVFRHFPLSFHPNAEKAAEAAACAQDQGKFWPMHDKMFTNQQRLAVEDLKSFAKDLGLDQGKFDKCLDSGEKAAMVSADEKDGEQAGVSGTPAFFINGIFINGAVPYEQFKDAVDRELKRKG